ncbi:MAG: rod shape-determining protein MreD [Spirochaetales bacterium]|nr:rod shape-determining protein MreD [Spirochaetales bacterium]
MKKTKIVLFTILASIVALVLQSTLFKVLQIWEVKPDLLLLVVIFIAIRGGSMHGQIAGFTAGMMQGFAAAPLPLGIYAAVKTIIGFFYGLLEGTVSIDPFFIQLLVVLIGTIFKYILELIVKLVFQIPLLPTGEYFAVLGLEVLYNMICAPFIFFIMNKINIIKEKTVESF